MKKTYSVCYFEKNGENSEGRSLGVDIGLDKPPIVIFVLKVLLGCAFLNELHDEKILSLRPFWTKIMLFELGDLRLNIVHPNLEEDE